MTDAQQEFARRVKDEWLPAFCADPKRRYDPTVFDPTAKVITDADARDFMRAIDSGIAFFDSRQRCGMRRGRASDAIFTEGKKATTRRPVSLWVETVLTVAAGARLHFTHGWPADSLGMQPHADFALDLAAFTTSDSVNQQIAAEIKPTLEELTTLSINLRRCCAGDHDDSCLEKHRARRNAHNKWRALRARQPPVLWLVSPAPHSEIYRLAYRADGVIEVEPADVSQLDFREALA